MKSKQAWNYAIGLAKVDGLEPSKEMNEYIEAESQGKITTADIKILLDKKYKNEKEI
jgi:hypothetical protein